MKSPGPAMRVALFFNHTVPFTTGHYVRSSLEKVCKVDVYLPVQAKDMAQGDYDFYLCIDDASHHLNLRHLAPTAFWAMDTHTSYRADLIMARRFDYVFVNDKGDAERFKRQGNVGARWLPVACDPFVHGKKSEPKTYDVAFIGGDGWGKRKQLLEMLRKEFPKSYIGRAPHTQLGEIYSRAKIVFNCSIRGDLNMRVFEALCSGSCLVTDAGAAGLADLFTPGTHLLTYVNHDEAIGLIRHCLVHHEERERVAQAGMTEVLAKHTYAHRVQTILETVYASSQNRQVSNGDRWGLRDLKDVAWLKALDQFYKVEHRIHRMFDV